MSLIKKPLGYPFDQTSAIYDARAFRVGSSEVVHAPKSFPNAFTVTGMCGVVGYIVESDPRRAEWADSEITCPTCINNPA